MWQPCELLYTCHLLTYLQRCGLILHPRYTRYAAVTSEVTLTVTITLTILQNENNSIYIYQLQTTGDNLSLTVIWFNSPQGVYEIQMQRNTV